MKRNLKRLLRFFNHILRSFKGFFKKWRSFNFRVALVSLWDGLRRTGKSPRYISLIQEYVDIEMSDLIEEFNEAMPVSEKEYDSAEKLKIWTCWWQGEESMPEIVKMCRERLKQVVPSEKAEIILITADNYSDYVEIPDIIKKKFEQGIITITTMSDILRFLLLDKYGGYWLDATVFFTGMIPEEYYSKRIYCQKMTNRADLCKREACGCNWCGFSMKLEQNSIIARYMIAAFSEWWSKYDDIIDYVLIDYLLMSGYKGIPQIKNLIDSVENNNEDIFEMYQSLNEPYSDELIKQFTQRNVMHKLTYKTELKKLTPDGKLTLYGYLLSKVFGTRL